MRAPQSAPGHAYWFRRCPRIALLAVLGLFAVLVLVGSELAARLLLPQLTPGASEGTFWVYDELLGWAHRPGHEARFASRDFDVLVRINSSGLRDDEYPRESGEKRRMLILGDSYAWGWGVEQRERFSERLERMHPRWEILNAAVSGYDTGQEYLYLKKDGLSFRPDVVLLLFYRNDLRDNVAAESSWHNKPRFTVLDGRLELRNTPVPPPSVRQRLGLFLRRKTVLWARAYQRAYRYAEGPASGGWDAASRREVTQRLLEAMAQLCTLNGSRFFLVSTPMEDRIPDFLREVAEAHRFPYLALDAAFAAAEVSLTFPHDHHWNREAHALAAAAINRFLEREGVFAYAQELHPVTPPDRGAAWQ